MAVAAAEIADKVDHFLYERFGDIQIMAQSPVFHGVDTAAKRKLLEAFKATYDPSYLWLAVTDANGRVVAASDRFGEGGLHSRTSWFQAVRISGEVYVGDAEPFGETGGQEAVTFSAPLFGSRGEFLGAVTTRVGIRDLQEIITHTVRVVQVQQQLPGLAGFQFLHHSGESVLDTDQGYEDRINLRQAGLPSALLSESTKPGYIEEDHLRRHVPVVTGYALTQGYKEFKGLKWSILVRLDRRDILSQYRTRLWQVVGVGSAMWVPLFAIVVWASVRLQKEHQTAQQESMRATAAAVASRESEERTRLLIDTALDAVVGMDEDGMITEWNCSAESTFGWASHEAIGKRLADLIIPPPSREAHLTGLRHFLAGGEAPHLNRRLDVVALRRDGTEFPIELKIAVLRRDGLFLFIAFIIDTSERKRLEQAQTKLIKDMQLLLESTGEGIYGVDREGRCTFINRAAAAMLGYRPDELITRHMHAVIHHSRHDGPPSPVEECALCKVFASARECRTEHEVLGRRDGTAFPVEYAAHPIVDQGVITGAVVFLVDISTRTKAEEAFREQSRLLEIFFHYTPTAIVFLDRNFNFLRVNDAYARACRRTISEFRGKNHGELYPPDAPQIFEEVRATKTPYHAVARPFVFPDHPEWGVTYWDWTLVPIVGASGEVDLLVLSLTDMTERARSADALRRSERQLRAALDERERLSQDLHDHVIQMLCVVGMRLEECQYLVVQDLEVAMTKIVHTIHDLNMVIRDVRNYIRRAEMGEQGRLDFEVAMAELMRVMGQSEAFQWDVQVDFNAAKEFTQDEAEQVLRIAEEAMSNSLRHSEGSRGLVLLRTESEWVRFEVQDDGIGFDQESPREQSQGLRNMASRVLRLGAHLHIVSGRGQGTRIILILPRRKTNA